MAPSRRAGRVAAALAGFGVVEAVSRLATGSAGVRVFRTVPPVPSAVTGRSDGCTVAVSVPVPVSGAGRTGCSSIVTVPLPERVSSGPPPADVDRPSVP
jgi:hypothetical protein